MEFTFLRQPKVTKELVHSFCENLANIAQEKDLELVNVTYETSFYTDNIKDTDEFQR